MKHIKSFKLYETGEWNKNITWEYVKNNPDDDSQESNMIFFLSETLSDLILLLNDDYIKILDIKGYDISTGPYANVSILGNFYKIWISNERDSDLYIENFPIDNCSEIDLIPGYIGSIKEIAHIINSVAISGGFELYDSTKKFNV